VAKVSIPQLWEVPDEFRRRLGERVGRQRAMFHDEHLLLVLHQPPQPDQDDRQAALFWRDAQGHWMSTMPGSGLGSLRQLLTDYEQSIDKLESAEQQAKSAAEYFAVIERIAPLLRSVRNLHGVLQEARRLVESDRDLINLRDTAYDLERRGELLDTGTRSGLEYAIALRAEEQAQSSQRMAVASHRLNLLAAFFFPLATLSAVFGVNLQFGLENRPGPWPFLVVMGVGLLMGVFLTSIIAPRR